MQRLPDATSPQAPSATGRHGAVPATLPNRSAALDDGLPSHSEALRNMFDTMEEGVSIFGPDLRLIGANRRLRELFDLPETLCRPGTEFEAIIRYNALRGDYGPGDVEEQVRDRVERAQRFEPHEMVRERPNGTVLQMRGRPLGGGGFVTIYEDITQSARAQAALRDSKAVLEATFEHIDQGISIGDANLVMIGMNRRFRELLDFPEWLCVPGTPFSAFIRYNAERGDYGPGDVEEQVRTRVEMARQFKAHHFERERPDGTVLEIRGTPMPSGGFVTIYTDVTKRARSERSLRESEGRFRSLTALSSDWFWEQDAAHRFTRIEGRPLDDASGGDAPSAGLGKTFAELGYEVDGGWDVQRALIEAQQPFRDVVMVRLNQDEGARYIRVSGEPILHSDGGFAGYRGVSRDITHEKTAEARIRYAAAYDGLTGLPNRTQFSQLLNAAIQAAQTQKRQFALLFIALDRFKVINDSLGHEAGDALLKAVASRLSGCVRKSDVVARLGGDEFVMLLQDLDDADRVTAIARKILESAAAPVNIQGQECRVSASIGISMYPSDAQDEATLMQNADAAMYRVKEQGKNSYRFYSKDVRKQSVERLTLEADLRRALEVGEFVLHYQAKLDLVSGLITGVEALVRWQHPERGLVAPKQFIPLAEETGLIVPIGNWVLRAACQQNVAWQRAGLPPLCVSVNISPRQFAHENLVSDIADALSESGLQPNLLELEITEGTVMDNLDHATRLLETINQMGVRLAIDDFGTGYSSLAQIKRFPIDTLKVDRSFVRDLNTNAEDRAITQAIIAMGKALGLNVVAEGVETPEQEDFLRQHSCDAIQGFRLSRPVVAQDFATFLSKHAGQLAAPRKTGLPGHVETN